VLREFPLYCCNTESGMDFIHPFAVPELEVGIVFLDSRSESIGVGESTSISSIDEALVWAGLIDDGRWERAERGPALAGTAIFVALL
jgi:hypothetical protein